MKNEGRIETHCIQHQISPLYKQVLKVLRHALLSSVDTLPLKPSKGSDIHAVNSECTYCRIYPQEAGAAAATRNEGQVTSTSDKSDDVLTNQLQNEYNSLQSHWKSILNKHHSNLALHSGMSVNNSKFQSRSVDVSFWEQVQSGMEHDRFKQRTANKTGGSDNISADGLQFDDSKLYQQMLKDFISSSQATNGAASTGKANKRGGMMLDPAQEAAERLKRAMRKKTGAGDVDLTSLLTESTTNANDLAAGGITKKKINTVDRRASKGRKIRYTVLPKMVNFTFPVSRGEPMIGDDVWLKSLFGGVGKV